MDYGLVIYHLLIASFSALQSINAEGPPPFKSLEFNVEPADTIVKSGERALLPCSAKYDSDREPTVYSWKRNDVLLTFWSSGPEQTRYVLNNGSLYFTSIKSSGISPDPGLYKCIAEVQEGAKVHRIATPEVKLRLADLPPLSHQPSSLSLAPGATAMFRCFSEGHPEVTYSWVHNGVGLRASNRVLLHSKGEVLEVRSIDSTDAGQYRCKAHNDVGEVSSNNAQLTVLTATTTIATTSSALPELPDGSGSGGSDSGLSGWFGLFGFGDSNDKKASTVAPVPASVTETVFPYWLYLNYTVPPEVPSKPTTSRPTTSRLTVSPQNVSSDTNTTRSLSTDATPTESAAPTFVMSPWDTSATEGSDVLLFCAVNGADRSGALPTVTWLKGGSTINTSSGGKFSIIGSGSLRIENVTRSDEGVYTCRGDNLEEIADAEATLSVKVPPYFVTRPVNTYGRVAEDIELHCDIRGIPSPAVQWLKDSDLVSESEYFKYIGHNLKILGLMETDSGYFQCVGKNDVGQVHSVAQLIVLDEDSPIPDEGIQSFTVEPPTQTIVPVDASLPPIPESLQAALVSQTYVTLTWSVEVRPGVSPVTEYTVSTKQVEDPNTRVRSVNTTSTDYTVEGLLSNTEYQFTVWSYNRNGRSMRSEEIVVSTEAEVAVPETVTNMRAQAISEESISVSWEPPSITNGPITNYKVFFYSEDQSRELFHQVTNTEVTLTDLHPYTEYYIRVVAQNKNGPGTPTEEQPVRTYSAKPSAAPEGVNIEVVSTTAVLIEWSPPPPDHTNGQITGYKIRYKEKDSSGRAVAHTTDADARRYEITGLSAGVTYVIRIAAVNINGTGEFTSWAEKATYTQELDESQAPGKPSYIQLKAFAREMIVSWGPTDASSDVLVRGFRLGYGVTIPEEHWVENISPGTRIHSLEGLEPLTNYVVQVMAYNNAGNGESAQQQTFTEEDTAPALDSELMPPLEVKVKVISPTSVMVTWYDSTLGQNQKVQDDRIYTVKYNALSGNVQRKTQFKNSTDLFVRVDGLRPYTKYEFSVMTIKGRRVSYYSLTARNTTFEDAPTSPPEDLTITPIESKPNMLMISWQPPSRPNGRIVTYTIYSNTNNQQPLDSWVVESVQGHELNHEFGPVTFSTVYFFRIAAHNSKGASPPSETKVIKTPELTLDIDGRPGGTLPDGSPIGGYGTEWYRPGDGEDNLDTTGDEPAVVVTSAPNSNLPSAQTLWIIIACVSAITALAIAALVAVLCRRKILNDRKKPSNLKASNQAPKGLAKGKQQHPDLWIDHEQVEMKAMIKADQNGHMIIDPNESTSMLQSHSQFDMASASMMGEPFMDEPRYSTLGRQRPVIIAPQQHRDDYNRYYETIQPNNPYSTMPRAAVQPMTMDNPNSRPLYPRTQFSSHNYGSTPRVHVGDTSQPISETSSFCTDPVTGLTGVVAPITPLQGYTNGELESYNQQPTSMPFNKPYMINGTEQPPPRPPPMEGRPYPLRSFNNTNGTNNIPKHIVKPQPISAFKPAAPVPEDVIAVETGSLKRPPRPPYANRQNSSGTPSNHSSLSKDHLKMTLKSGSTEQLSSEMANLDTIMQDLNSMKNDFEYAA